MTAAIVQIMDSAETDRREAIRHLSAELIAIWCDLNPSSESNKRRRAAICEKLRKWGKSNVAFHRNK